MTDVKFENVHLKKLNEIVEYELFKKNDLYINSITLWELMQPLGDSGSHNFHELTPSDISNSLNSLGKPYCIYKVKNNRFGCVPFYISSFKTQMIIVIEIGVGLINNTNANINKIVTMYPISDLNHVLEKTKSKDILFIK